MSGQGESRENVRLRIVEACENLHNCSTIVLFVNLYLFVGSINLLIGLPSQYGEPAALKLSTEMPTTTEDSK